CTMHMHNDCSGFYNMHTLYVFFGYIPPYNGFIHQQNERKDSMQVKVSLPPGTFCAENHVNCFFAGRDCVFMHIRQHGFLSFPLFRFSFQNEHPPHFPRREMSVVQKGTSAAILFFIGRREKRS
ncbi:MAG: hypothetical protein IKG53_05415, partial [Solobacterium sp.]|nr:hypothetical protein [Solobacterium sp.]